MLPNVYVPTCRKFAPSYTSPDLAQNRLNDGLCVPLYSTSLVWHNDLTSHLR